jgi:hypothetical protein
MSREWLMLKPQEPLPDQVLLLHASESACVWAVDQPAAGRTVLVRQHRLFLYLFQRWDWRCRSRWD